MSSHLHGTKTPSPAPELRALADLINISTLKIEALLASRSQKFPSADEPFDITSEVSCMSPDVAEEISLIVAATTQLTAAARIPTLSLMFHGLSFYIPTCINIAIRCHVPELLTQAGTKGLHVSQLAEKSSVDPQKLSRCHRLPATNYIFKEISPDVFAHNRVSSLLDTGSSISVILSSPEHKHDDSPGLTALLEHFTDEGLKSAAWLSEALLSPTRASSGESDHTAFNMAFHADVSMWSWLELPGNAYNLRRFNLAMLGVKNMGVRDDVVNGFEWNSLPKGSIIVDVGGGIGTHALSIGKANGHLNFVVQDLDRTIQEARKYWDQQWPEAVKSGSVALSVHDFFAEQPVKNPKIFYLRMILHDWSDDSALQILKRLRAAAGVDTRLLIVDNIVPYACREHEDNAGSLTTLGATTSMPPYPLLANTGPANAVIYHGDLHMMTLYDGMERTLMQFETILKRSGWKLERVYHCTELEIQNAELVATPSKLEDSSIPL